MPHWWFESTLASVLPQSWLPVLLTLDHTFVAEDFTAGQLLIFPIVKHHRSERAPTGSNRQVAKCLHVVSWSLPFSLPTTRETWASLAFTLLTALELNESSPKYVQHKWILSSLPSYISFYRRKKYKKTSLHPRYILHNKSRNTWSKAGTESMMCFALF